MSTGFHGPSVYTLHGLYDQQGLCKDSHLLLCLHCLRCKLSGFRHVPMVEYLSSKCETLGSSPSTVRKEIKMSKIKGQPRHGGIFLQS